LVVDPASVMLVRYSDPAWLLTEKKQIEDVVSLSMCSNNALEQNDLRTLLNKANLMRSLGTRLNPNLKNHLESGKLL
jgi:hypothetical protein